MCLLIVLFNIIVFNVIFKQRHLLVKKIVSYSFNQLVILLVNKFYYSMLLNSLNKPGNAFNSLTFCGFEKL